MRQKKTPPKAGFLGFSLGVLPCFHSVKKPSSQMNHASEILLGKPPRISCLTDLQRPHHHGGGQLLTRFGSSHPLKRLSRLLFLCLDSTHLRCTACMRPLCQVRARSNNLLGVRKVCERCHDHDCNDHCAAKESDVW